MREIKFRAWDAQNRFYIQEGHCVIHGDGVVCVEDYSGDGTWHENGPIKIEMFTGILDKNGTEIYDGDILNSKNDGSDGADVWDYETHRNLVVRWNSDGACYQGLPHKESYSVFSEKYIEVIGNIHEGVNVLEKMC